MKEPKKQGDLLWKPCPRLIEGSGGQGGLCPAVFLHRSDTPDPIISPLSCLPSILLPISHGAVSDHMFYPLSPATRPYYINLLSFPVTCSLPVNSPFPTAKPQLNTSLLPKAGGQARCQAEVCLQGPYWSVPHEDPF